MFGIPPILHTTDRGVAITVLFLTRHFFAFAPLCLYSANLVSSFTVSRLATPISSVASLVNTGTTTGVIKDSFGLEWITQTLPSFSGLVRPYSSATAAVADLGRGLVGAVIIKGYQANYYANMAPYRFMSVAERFAFNFYSVGVRKQQVPASVSASWQARVQVAVGYSRSHSRSHSHHQ